MKFIYLCKSCAERVIENAAGRIGYSYIKYLIKNSGIENNLKLLTSFCIKTSVQLNDKKFNLIF